MGKSKRVIEYPVSIRTLFGSVETGWSENQSAVDVLLISTFLERESCTLIHLYELYQQNAPISALQYQIKILIDSAKAQKQLMHYRRKRYER